MYQGSTNYKKSRGENNNLRQISTQDKKTLNKKEHNFHYQNP